MADHICDICRPYQEKFDRIQSDDEPPTSFVDHEVARLRLRAVRAFLCSDTSPPLDDAYQPGGSQRDEFLRERIKAPCEPCQRLADQVVITSMVAREHRAQAQAQQLAKDSGRDTSEDYPYGAMSLVYTSLEAEMEKLLEECYRIKCAKRDQQRAAEGLLDAIGDYKPPPRQRPPDKPDVRPPEKPPDKVDTKKAGAGATIRSPLVFWVLFLVALVAGGAWWLFGDSGDAAQPSGGLVFAETDAGSAIVDAALAFGADPDTLLPCIANGLALRNTTDAEIEVMGNPDVSTWPDGLAERYAQVLEECFPLRPYYLDLFGQYEYVQANCPTTMTDLTLASYSWFRFLNDGILDPNLAPGIQTAYNVFSENGYRSTGCLSAETGTG